MDDFSIVDERLVRTLYHIRRVNQWTLGYRATMRILQPFLLKHRQGPIRILDIGTGIADFPVEIVRWSAVQGIDVHVYALDANATTIAEAQAWVDQELPDERAESITLDVKNIMNTSFDTGAFDVVHGVRATNLGRAFIQKRALPQNHHLNGRICIGKHIRQVEPRANAGTAVEDFSLRKIQRVLSFDVARRHVVTDGIADKGAVGA